MPIDPVSTSHAAWNLLPGPAHASGCASTQLLHLLAALDTGWQVEESVYLRSRWSDGGPQVYHFILRRSPQTDPHLLSVPANAMVERFLHNDGLHVVS
jgi:hypothetical protein